MIKKIKGDLPDPKSFKNDFKALPMRLANHAKNHFLKGFKRNGGMTNESRGGWPRRRSGSQRNRGRSILVDTGALRRSIKVYKVSHNISAVGTGIHYGKYHNEGKRPQPKREFIGDSDQLDREIRDIIEKSINF